MTRAEFTKAVKRQAWERSKGRCEARGVLYGFPQELSALACGADLKRSGVEYDHIILEANSHDNSLENCAAVCPSCHRLKTSRRDIPTAAKTVRQQDKARGIKSNKPSWPKPLDPWGKQFRAKLATQTRRMDRT